MAQARGYTVMIVKINTLFYKQGQASRVTGKLSVWGQKLFDTPYTN
jgi:hypothetical protein